MGRDRPRPSQEEFEDLVDLQYDVSYTPKEKPKKSVVVEHRYVGPRREDYFLQNLFDSMREWHHFRRYVSAEDAEKGIKAMERKDKKWEYRIV